MSFSLSLIKSIAVTDDGATPVQKDIPNSTSALFMFDVTALKGSLLFTLQVLDAASRKWFDFANVPEILEPGQYTFPDAANSTFFQSIPSDFRIMWRGKGKQKANATFSIGFNAVS